MRLAGVDFTSSPSARKPMTVAHGVLDAGRLHVERVDGLRSLDAFASWLSTPGPWLAAFDFPFGLPREFVESNALGTSCAEVIAAVHARCATRMQWRALIDGWGHTRPAGTKLLHRRTDLSEGVGSTSPLQTRYVPVGLMYYEGVARLVASGASMPGLVAGDPSRIALEGYPRRLAHALVGRRSYKNSDAPDRRDARGRIVDALEAGAAGAPLRIDTVLRRSLVADATGDRLDAVLCLAQAARAAASEGWGLPDDVDPVEGWIVGA